MERIDQMYRDSLMSVGASDKNYPIYRLKIKANDESNQAILNKIVAYRGWPKLSLFGKNAIESAWLIVLHASAAYQHRYFPWIEQAYLQGEIPAAHFQTLKAKLSTGYPAK